MRIKRILLAGALGLSALSLSSCGLINELIPESKPIIDEIDNSKAAVRFIYSGDGRTLGEDEITCSKNETLLLDGFVKSFDGFKFEGWFGDPNFKTPLSSNKLLIISDATLFAKYSVSEKPAPTPVQKVELEIRFLDRTMTRSFDEGSLVDIGLCEPSIKNYEFDGWFLDKEYTVPVYDNFIINENTVLYARMKKIADEVKPKKVTLTVVSAIGRSYYELERGPVTLSHYIPITDDYVFAGWYYNYDYETPVTEATINLSDNTTLYAKLIKKEDIPVKTTVTLSFVMHDNKVLKKELPIDQNKEVVLEDVFNTLYDPVLYRGSEFTIHTKDDINSPIATKADLKTDKTYYVFGSYNALGFIQNYKATCNNFSFGGLWDRSGLDYFIRGRNNLNAVYGNSFFLNNEFLKLDLDYSFFSQVINYNAFKGPEIPFYTEGDGELENVIANRYDVKFMDESYRFVLNKAFGAKGTSGSGSYIIRVDDNTLSLSTEERVSISLVDENNINNKLEITIEEFKEINEKEYISNPLVRITGNIGRTTISIDYTINAPNGIFKNPLIAPVSLEYDDTKLACDLKFSF